jgi:DNA-directed RNA polymerase subunit D
MPLTILLKNQDLQLEAVARLGKGKEHAKFSPGLAYYRFYPELKLTKDSNIKKCAELSKNLVVKGTKLEIKDITAWTEADEQICEENKVEVDHNQEEFIFTLESWGQLDTKKLPNLALEILEKKLKELDKLIK